MEKVTKFLSLVLVGLLLSIGVFSCAPTPTPKVEPIVWRFNNWNTQPIAGTAWQIDHGYIEAVNEIREKSDGRLIIDIYWSGELGYKGPELLKSLGEGTLEMSMIPLGVLAIDHPWCGIDSLPLMLDSIGQRQVAIEALCPLYDELVAQNNCRILCNHGLVIGYIGLHTNKSMQKLEDFDGMKLRVYAKYDARTFEKAGAIPTFMSMDEFYMAMKTGIVDGGEAGEGGIVCLKLDEVSTYCINLWPSPLGCFVAVSNKAFDILPKDLQEMVVDAFKKVEQKTYAQMGNINNEQHLSNMEYAKEHGLTIELLPDSVKKEWEPYAREVWAEWLEDCEAAGEREIAERAFVAVAKVIGKEELLNEVELKYYQGG